MNNKIYLEDSIVRRRGAQGRSTGRCTNDESYPGAITLNFSRLASNAMHQTQIEKKDKVLMKDVAVMEDKEVKQVWKGEVNPTRKYHSSAYYGALGPRFCFAFMCSSEASTPKRLLMEYPKL